MDKRYKSDIPKNAEERMTRRHASGEKASAQYFVRGNLVGDRCWDNTHGPFGEDPVPRPLHKRLTWEMPYRNGVMHGRHYYLENGLVTFIEPHKNGQRHGIARQYGDDGKLIGSYRMVHGTGIDLWRNERLAWRDGTCKPSGECYLAEACYWVEGQLQGFVWWINEDQQSVFVERHLFKGLDHGIHREWNGHGRLSRGYPKYFVQGKQIKKRQYLRACLIDPTLPVFREKDNKPRRTFPPEIAKHLNPPKRKW